MLCAGLSIPSHSQFLAVVIEFSKTGADLDPVLSISQITSRREGECEIRDIRSE